jgi:MarR family transcriptional regulator, organic hydroperoxide resistance regulator
VTGTGSYPGSVAGGAGRDFDEEIVGHLFALVDRLRVGFDAVVGSFDLSAPQAKALHYVVEAGPVPMRDLACCLRCDASNVTGIVDRLEQRGLVERQAAPTDRRVKSLVATPRGAELARAVWHRVQATSIGVGVLSPEEGHQLLVLLRRLDQGGERCWTG